MANLRYPSDSSLYFHNELATVLEHADGYVRIDWHPIPIQSTTLRAVYKHVLELFLHSGLGKLLSDHQHRPPLLEHDLNWINQQWVPQALRQTNYRYCAVVLSPDPLTRTATLAANRQLDDLPVRVEYFEDERRAAQWLFEAGS